MTSKPFSPSHRGSAKRHDRAEAGHLYRLAHYLVGVSVSNLVKIVSVFSSFKVSPGGLTQAWMNLASLLEPLYNEIGQEGFAKRCPICQ